MYKSRSGFTLVELLIVIVIIAILAAITIVAYNGITDRAKDSAESSTVTQFIQLLELYNADNSDYPNLCNVSSISGCDTSGGTFVTQFKALMVPQYTQQVPAFPLYTEYVRGSSTSYGIKITHADGSTCKTGVNVGASWWNSSSGVVTPMC